VIITPNLDKQEEASDVAQQNSGHIYACLGVHPHNIKRTNDKLYQQHVDNLRSMVRAESLTGELGRVSLHRG